MNFVKEKVTPSIAKEWLAKNVSNNRYINDRRITQFARLMATGNWSENTGESIKFNKNGKLIDGQHRMMALIKANRTMYFCVHYDLPNDAINYIDQNAPRSTGNVLHIHNIPNANSISKGVKLYKLAVENEGYFKRQTGIKYSPIEIMNEYNKDPDFFQQGYKLSSRLYRSFNRLMAPSFIAALYCYCLKYSDHKNKVDPFFESFFDYSGNACRTLVTARKKLLDDKLSITKKLPMDQRYNLIVKAYNNFAIGKTEMSRIPLDTYESVL